MRGLTRKGTNQLPPVPAPCFSLCASLLYFNLRSYRGLTDAGTHGGRMLPASHNTCCAVNIGHDKSVFLHMFYRLQPTSFQLNQFQLLRHQFICCILCVKKEPTKQRTKKQMFFLGIINIINISHAQPN